MTGKASPRSRGGARTPAVLRGPGWALPRVEAVSPAPSAVPPRGGTPQPCHCVGFFFNLIVILLAVDMQSVAQLRLPDGAFGRARGTITLVVGAVRGSGLSRRVPPCVDGHTLGKPTTCSRRRTLCRCLAHPDSSPRPSRAGRTGGGPAATAKSSSSTRAFMAPRKHGQLSPESV